MSIVLAKKAQNGNEEPFTKIQYSIQELTKVDAEILQTLSRVILWTEIIARRVETEYRRNLAAQPISTAQPSARHLAGRRPT